MPKPAPPSSSSASKPTPSSTTTSLPPPPLGWSSSSSSSSGRGFGRALAAGTAFGAGAGRTAAPFFGPGPLPARTSMISEQPLQRIFLPARVSARAYVFPQDGQVHWIGTASLLSVGRPGLGGRLRIAWWTSDCNCLYRQGYGLSVGTDS